MIREFIENLLSYLTLKVSFMTHTISTISTISTTYHIYYILYLKELIEYMYIFKILVYIF